ncbi:hypothetical protein CDAR_173401 [Caerostris darwini]|uniref:Uncharacterized protein n=1 Tax=Caerostris darwini TaxID=1538125 RepID=A0AAV4SUB0_9ARAC|nr:hypothetical protein CDAR_173401 [Caerostris darwini]
MNTDVAGKSHKIEIHAFRNGNIYYLEFPRRFGSNLEWNVDKNLGTERAKELILHLQVMKLGLSVQEDKFRSRDILSWFGQENTVEKE